MNLARALPREPDDLLERSLRRIGLASAAALLFDRYATLKVVTSRLANYLSDLPRNASSGRAIIDIAIEQALIHAHQDDVPDPTVYLQRLVNAATMVLGFEIRDGAEVWNPVGSSSLDGWLERHPRAVVRPSPREITPYRSADFRHYLASRLLTTSELAAIGTSIEAVAKAPD